MLDILGALALSALALVTPAVLLGWAPLSATTRWRLAAAAALWLAAVAGLATAGLFAAPLLGTPAIGLAVLLPVALAVAARHTSLVSGLALGIPAAVLVAVNAGRLLGAFFVALLAEGRLSPTFATTAGWGDIAVAVLAVPVAWVVHRRWDGWRALLLGWNTFGFLDLAVAVTLGVGSAPGTLQFIVEAPGSGLMRVLPWALIPAFLVPLFFLTHLALFAQLAAGRTQARAVGAARALSR